MNPEVMAAARQTAAQLLANLDDPDSRNPLILDLIEQFDDNLERIQGIGAALALCLDALLVVAERQPASRQAIAEQISLLVAPLNRSQRRAIERDARRGH